MLLHGRNDKLPHNPLNIKITVSLPSVQCAAIPSYHCRVSLYKSAINQGLIAVVFYCVCFANALMHSATVQERTNRQMMLKHHRNTRTDIGRTDTQR